MKYLVLIYDLKDQGPAPGSPEFHAYMEKWVSVGRKFREESALVGGEALQPSSTAPRVRVRGGKTETMDGPFA